LQNSLHWKTERHWLSADEIGALEFLHFAESRMFRGAGFQAGYARFHAGILPTALLLAAQVEKLLKKNFLNTTVVCSRLNL